MTLPRAYPVRVFLSLAGFTALALGVDIAVFLLWRI